MQVTRVISYFYAGRQTNRSILYNRLKTTSRMLSQYIILPLLDCDKLDSECLRYQEAFTIKIEVASYPISRPSKQHIYNSAMIVR